MKRIRVVKNIVATLKILTGSFEKDFLLIVKKDIMDTIKKNNMIKSPKYLLVIKDNFNFDGIT